MSKERVIEVGGETLKAGDTVIVYNGRSSREAPITRIGTRRIFLKVHGREAPFSIESRKDCVNTAGYTPYFRTRTEEAAGLKRQTLMTRLNELGLGAHSSDDWLLSRYPDGVLEKMISILEEYQESGS